MALARQPKALDLRAMSHIHSISWAKMGSNPRTGADAKALNPLIS